MTLKAFQKNAVQSYFERQQQQQQHHQHHHQQQQQQNQQHQQTSPVKETAESPKSAKLRTNHNANGVNGNMNYENNGKSPVISNGNGITSNGTNVIRPQSMPVTKLSSSMESIPQTRLSLPNKLSQIINLTTQLAAQKHAAVNGNANLLDRQNDRMKSPVKSTVVKLPLKQTTRPTVITADKNNLQSINESGVPPPPPRRSNRVIPVRR